MFGCLRRGVSLVSATVLLFSNGAPTVLAASFADVRGSVFETSVTYLANLGVIGGYPDGSMRPNAPLSRAEALKVILVAKGTYRDRLAWYSKHMPSLPLFSDVDQRAWYGPYVEVAFQEDIVKGYPDSTFRPGGILTVEEAVALLMRTYGEASAGGSADLSEYIENRDGQWFTGSINAAVRKNLVMHRGFLPLGRPITRGQFFDIVYRMHVVKSKNLTAYADAEPENIAVPRAVPMARSEEVTTPRATPSGETGVVTFDSDDEIPASATSPRQEVAPARTMSTIDHPYASQKHFAITMPTLAVSDLTVTHPGDPLSKEGILEPLKYGVGHLFGYPGGGGKIMVYGHSSGYAWDVSEYTKIFRRINELNVGDRVYVTFEGKLYVYEVTLEQTVLASDTAPFKDEGTGEELILYTCWPPDSISQRYLIHATPVETIALE